MTDVAEAIREDDDFAFGSVRIDTSDGDVLEVSGWVTFGVFERTDEPAVSVIEADDDTPGGDPTRHHMFPLDRLVAASYDWGDLPKDVAI